uniref:Uncharacterized protein n=1 Tax=Picea glauca TaxID=3330 RepID=A0A101LZU1_PICGL|nr:hypothetical protein ABT39_MTgene4439 [Picea glauca]QHR88834.1 hypothetical protein Q903MT_gene2853 [Picea sitchensis]
MNKASEPIGLFFSTFRLKLRSIAFILILIIDESMQILFFRIGQASVDLRAIIIYGIMPFGKIDFVHFDQLILIKGSCYYICDYALTFWGLYIAQGCVILILYVMPYV